MSSVNARKDKWFGKLYAEEIALAKTIFQGTLPYDRIFISNSKNQTQGITISTRANRKKAKYLLLWSKAYKTNIAKASDRMKETFIHELVHVWQGQYSGSSGISYMANSTWNQFSYGVKDIFKNGLGGGSKRISEMFRNGLVKEWGVHRNKAYSFGIDEIGKDFKTFNVEQQALIIESWYAKKDFLVNKTKYPAGKESEDDERFPYVRDCIRKGNPNASYSKEVFAVDKR